MSSGGPADWPIDERIRREVIHLFAGNAAGHFHGAQEVTGNRRTCRHEAGHIVAGYLLGFYINGVDAIPRTSPNGRKRSGGTAYVGVKPQPLPPADRELSDDVWCDLRTAVRYTAVMGNSRSGLNGKSIHARATELRYEARNLLRSNWHLVTAVEKVLFKRKRMGAVAIKRVLEKAQREHIEAWMRAAQDREQRRTNECRTNTKSVA